MCGFAVHLCLLLCIVVLAVSTTLGKVITTANLTTEVGRALTLSCNFTISADETIHQVRWLNKHGKTLLAHDHKSPIHISQQELNVHLASSNNGASSITIKTVTPEDEGCYSCIFDVFPGGQQEGKTCIIVTGNVQHEGNKTAIAGKLTTLSCLYTFPGKVLQVLWRKTAEQGDTTMVASYSKHGHKSIAEMFLGRVNLSRNLGETQLTIQPVKIEDEACYTCEFHTYPDGTRSATACLYVYVLPKPEVRYVTLPSGAIEANCSTQSRPSANITWSVVGENITLGPPVTSSHEQGDGTTVVTSTLLIKSGALTDVKCIVHHRGLDKLLSVPLSNVGPAMAVVLSVCGVAAVLLLCLCGCLCKCFVCNND